MKSLSADPNRDLSAIYNSQKEFFKSGATRSVAFRKDQLRKLRALLKKNEKEILEALAADLGKPELEGYSSEAGLTLMEISDALKNLKKWAAKKKVSTSLLHFPSSSYIQPEPKGVSLIIGPWNYPLLLLLSPLVAAIAAGNTAMLKPPEQTPHTSLLVEKLITGNFEAKYLAVVQGEGSEIVPELMNNFRFDHVFFTGSVPVGRKIAEMAAPKLVPLTLELGGKSPAVIDKDVDIPVTARRVAFGKWLNAGQTCVAPDYLLIHRSIKHKFLTELQRVLREFYGEYPLESEHYAKIISADRFEKLKSYLKEGKIITGGQTDAKNLKMAPTIIDEVRLGNKLMKEEIFGPILPILDWNSLSEADAILDENLCPLAFYVFTKNKEVEKHFVEGRQFGGGMVNNAVLHLSNLHLPFGGIGNSGFGNYHGKAGFDTFSHQKAIMKTGTWMDLKLKYPPYKNFALKVVKKFMR